MTVATTDVRPGPRKIDLDTTKKDSTPAHPKLPAIRIGELGGNKYFVK